VLKKVKAFLNRYWALLLAYFMAFYTIPMFIVMTGKEFDVGTLIIALLYCVNCGVSLIATGYDTWTKGFHWISIVLPVVMFFPSAFLFYAGSTMSLLFCIGYSIPAGMAAAFTQYVRMMHQRRRKL